MNQNTKMPDDRKTKSQLIKDLRDCQKINKKQEAELQNYKQQLDEANIQIETLQRQLKESLDQIKSLEEKLEKQAEADKTEKREFERKQQILKSQIAELKEQLEALESFKGKQETEQENLEELAASKSSFRIDIYPRQGHFQGKIEHLLSKDKKAFSDLDHKTIIGFISEHLPALEEMELPGVEIFDRQKMEGVSKQSPESVSPSVKLPQLTELMVISKGSNMPSRVLIHNEPFEIVMNLDLSQMELSEDILPIGHKVTIFAKELPGGTRTTIAQVEGIIETTDKLPIRTHARSLPPGTYRLEASLSFKQANGKPAPTVAFLEGGFITVF